MLRSTFQHIFGVSADRERELWQRGVHDWEDFRVLVFPAEDLFSVPQLGGGLAGFASGESALRKRDFGWFSQRLPRQLLYRVALTEPDTVIFLDIETTGRSSLGNGLQDITMVGWSIGGRFKAWLATDDESELRADLKRACAIVTFNGTGFDLPHIRSHFPELELPACHIDLRPLAKRYEWRGGQKAIERELAFDRASITPFDSGDFAPRLWSQWLSGDADALRALIAYNYADVAGMTWILEACIRRALDEQDVPLLLRPETGFHRALQPLAFSGVGDAAGVDINASA